MANVEINDLTAKTTASETDELEIQETAGGLSKKITRANFIPDSSETVKGKVELATTAEATTGTDTARAVTPAGVKAVADTKANTSHTHAASDVTSGLLANARIATGTPDGTKFLRDDQVWTNLPGGGDMLAATYDPQAIASDAFDVDNHTNGTTNKVYTATEKTKLAGIATGATANDTDANLKARANHTGTQTASTISDFSTAADARITAAAGSSIASLSGGKVPTSQLPAISLTTVQTAVSQVAQLALTAEAGDVVVRTDENKTYMHNGGTAGTMADYTLLNTPADAVTSVNGQTGVVSLAKGDVGLGNVDNTSDATKNAASVTLTNKTLTSPVINTPTGLVKGDVGLGNVDNTSDATKDAATTTLTNKTLTTPTIGSFTNATHTHQNAAGGGTLDAAAIAAGTMATARLGSGSASSSTYLRGDQTWATIAAGGQTTVTKTVAASGGDYTTLGAAIAAASAGWIIQVLDATTESGAITSSLNNLTIIGSNRITSVVGLSSNLLTLSGTGVTLLNLGFSATTGGVVLSGANAVYQNGYCSSASIPTANHLLMSGADARLEGMYYEYTSATSLANKSPIYASAANARISGCRFYTNGLTAGGYLLRVDGDGSIVTNSTFKCVTSGQTTALRFAGIANAASNCYFDGVNNANAYGISLGNDKANITNCNFKGWGIGVIAASSINYLTLTGNNFEIPSSGGWGFSNVNQINVSTITGNNFVGVGATSSIGCKFNSSVNRDVVVTGNTFYSLSLGVQTGTNTGQSTGMSIVNNNFRFCTTNVTVNASYHNVNVWNNSGLPDRDQTNIIEMKNTSGGTVNYGSCVILKVSTGEAAEFTTTTTASDPLVYGVLGDDIANNATGSVVLQGQAAGNLVRVDGTGTAIAAGDFITTSTTAGIGVKATAGQTAYAIALASASSSVRIKALLIRPRVI